jgi:hypothetical protein
MKRGRFPDRHLICMRGKTTFRKRVESLINKLHRHCRYTTFGEKRKGIHSEFFFRESLLFERRTNLGQFPAPKTTVTTALRDKTPLGASVAVIASEATAKASFALRYTGWVAVVPSVTESGEPKIIW